MPEKQLTIATYAAGASLAAITLVYVFAPTFFIDGEANGSSSGRKKGVVGLVNTANDCFINSVLQALAGLGDLRIYLIREIHRRNLDAAVYRELAEDPARRSLPAWKIEGLQRGIVTRGLKDILDALNERPISKKTISATPFIRVLEEAFRQRISRQQQDAQEFLQVVAERLCDEYHAGRRARQQALKADLARQAITNASLSETSLDHRLNELKINGAENGPENGETRSSSSGQNGEPAEQDSNHVNGNTSSKEDQDQSDPARPSLKTDTSNKASSFNSQQELSAATLEDEDGFPLEGKFESQIECLTCGFKPKPSESTFCSLTLNVPQVNSTTLNACFDGMFKTEYIDDFKCEKCRLVHAVEVFQQEVAKSTSEKFITSRTTAISRLQTAIDINPEDPPKDIELPDSKFTPKRRIARHIRITGYPKILAIHLSRSIFDVGKASLKNSAKVAFPERLPLGGILDQQRYKLLGLVTHKGSHHSGHYESFRRQNIYPPYSNPNFFNKSGVYSKTATPVTSVISTPHIGAAQRPEDISTTPSTPELLSPGSHPASSRVSLASSLSSPQSRPSTSTDSLYPLPNGRAKSQASPNPSGGPGPTSAPRETPPTPNPETSSIRSVARSARATLSKIPSNVTQTLSRPSTPSKSTESPTIRSPTKSVSKDEDGKPLPPSATSAAAPGYVPPPVKQRRKKGSDRWWRISDDKVKESKTGEVLGMQKEVYLLFYELQRGEDEF